VEEMTDEELYERERVWEPSDERAKGLIVIVIMVMDML
jgi:hypothetical protein